ncbi:MAG: Mpo1-like protein [Planctomycetota bacterium]
MLKPVLKRYFEEYAEAHQHPTNRLTHKIAIPLIVFHILAMLDWWKLFSVGNSWSISAGQIFFLFVMCWYCFLHIKLAMGMMVLFIFCFPIGRYTPPSVVIGIAIVAWGIQLAGHVIWEKKSPAFLTNLIQALVGPLFFMALLLGEWPVRPEEVNVNS